ncbi:hypothetical protein BGZ68_008631 [Mortierella alpina]|nr:hypothetical protein BGZ68_008631 [Mortierella alpina]
MEMQIQFLKQRGIAGEPILPLSMRVAGNKLTSMNGTVKRLRKESKKEYSDDFVEDSLAGEAKPESSWKLAELAVQE